MIAFATTNNNIYIFKATDATQMVWLGPLKKLLSITYIYDKDRVPYREQIENEIIPSVYSTEAKTHPFPLTASLLSNI